MMSLDSALFIMMVEVSIVLIVLALVLFFLAKNKRNKEINAIHGFIDQLENQSMLQNRSMDQLLSDICGLDRATVDATLKSINDSERALLQTVIQLFLRRETSLLEQINQNMERLAEPYCMLLGNQITHQSVSSNTDNQNQGLERINQQLVRQLDTAMQTIDEITAEYTRVFSGNQTALELENSSKKMLKIFQEAEQKIKQNL